MIDDKPDLTRRESKEPVHEVGETVSTFTEEKLEPVRTVFADRPTAVAVPETAKPEIVSPQEVPQEAKDLPTFQVAAEDHLRQEAETVPEKVSGDEHTFEERLKSAIDGLTGGVVARTEGVAVLAETGESQIELEAQFKTVLNQAMGEAALKLSSAFAPILTQYVEDYVKRMLMEIAEKVIREEIDKLLKESAG